MIRILKIIPFVLLVASSTAYAINVDISVDEDEDTATKFVETHYSGKDHDTELRRLAKGISKKEIDLINKYFSKYSRDLTKSNKDRSKIIDDEFNKIDLKFNEIHKKGLLNAIENMRYEIEIMAIYPRWQEKERDSLKDHNEKRINAFNHLYNDAIRQGIEVNKKEMTDFFIFQSEATIELKKLSKMIDRTYSTSKIHFEEVSLYDLKKIEKMDQHSDEMKNIAKLKMNITIAGGFAMPDIVTSYSNIQKLIERRAEIASVKMFL